MYTKYFWIKLINVTLGTQNFVLASPPLWLISLVYFLMICRICLFWCCMLYWAFSALVMSESSLSRCEPIFSFKSIFFGFTETFSACWTASLEVSIVRVSSSVGCSWLAAFSTSPSGDRGLWSGVLARELTRTRNRVLRLPQTVWKLLSFHNFEH